MQLTVTNKGLVKRIFSEAVIIADTGVSIKVPAMWDTGATFSAISDNIADKLNLKTSGLNKYVHAVGVQTSTVYLAEVEIKSGWNIGNVKLTGVPNIHAFGMIIGMDVINRGKFCIENVNGNTVFTFTC